MNIIISGLTAAGKTTHALLLARRLGFDYLSASELMLNQMAVTPDANNALWVTRLKEIETRRNQEPVDELVNTILADSLRTCDATVFDSWSASWLPGAQSCLRIWIESTPESRAMKARASQEPYGPFLTLEECASLIASKDDGTARRFASLLGADIISDRSVFDLVLDNSHLITEPTMDSAQRGITTFHQQLVDVVTQRMPERSVRLPSNAKLHQ